MTDALTHDTRQINFGLHRVEGSQAQWKNIPEEDWNPWQRIANDTHGIVTPGALETAKGVLAGFAGLDLLERDEPWAALAGTALVIYARIKDISDGRESEKWGTKSPLGEIEDTVADFSMMNKALKVLGRTGIVPENELDQIKRIFQVKMASSGLAKLLGHEIHPRRTGKISSAAHWSAIVGYLVAHVANKYDMTTVHDKADKAAQFVSRLGIGLGWASAGMYVYDAVRPDKKQA